LPVGYRAQVLIPWGTPLTGDYPGFDAVNGNTGEQQEQQIGSHHDGMHFFPFPADPNGHGLLCVNHEYVDQNVFHAGGASLVAGQRPTDEVRKEIAAHGVSVVEIRKEPTSGQWGVVQGRYNRRITGSTPMEIRGPVRGSDFVKTRYSHHGTMTRGTLNNCAHGYTPWGTYLTCEENWAGYFVNRSGLPREHSRFGVPTGNSRYRWETAQSAADEYLRFDASSTGVSALDDYRNEPNGQGWIVEIDPFNPNATPIKRTALGRFAHEGIVFAPPQVGQPLAFYMGDDAQDEYVYKFVTKAR
jgi:secreted PhoX family phosphatase